MAMDPKRRRRRQRRAVAVFGFMVVALGLAYFFESQATTTIIVVRHADTLGGSPDADLSPGGRVRAEELAHVLGDVDVVQGLDAILIAPGPAARETAAPVARSANLAVEETAMDDPEALAGRILRDYKGLVVLVVTDGPVVPRLIPEFQGSKKVPEMAANEFDDIYVVSVPWYGKVKTLRLRYGSRPGTLLPPG